VQAKTTVHAVDALKRAIEPHWAVLALMGATSCAYDWIAETDTVAWLGDTDALFGEGATPPQTRALFRSLMAPGTQLPYNACNPAAGGDMETHSGRYSVRRAGGDYRTVEDRGMVMRGAGGHIERVVGIICLIEADLAVGAEQAGHLDRGQMRDAIDAAIDWAKTADRPSALLMASIDGLGAINDAYGLDVADEVIAETTRRIASALGTEGAIGRVGGNKVAALLLDCDVPCINDRAEAMQNAVQASLIATRGGSVAATISIGALALPSGAPNSEVALLRAEDALSQAKKFGRSNMAIYDASPEREAARRKKASIGAEITAALRGDRFRIAYQPIVCARTGRVESYEALIRMLGVTGDLVPAGDFIPAAEELGLVRDLDRKVLELCAVSLKRAPGLKLAVNLSGMSVGDPTWMRTFDAHIAGDRSLTSRLTVEVTETAALHDIEEGIRFVKQVRAAGCRVAIDDFGAGYTSFRNLQTLDLNCVKIDGSFVKGITRRPDNQAFVRTLVSLAKTFKLEVVAEWVGSAEEAGLLKALGVDRFQGAFYGMPDMTPPWDRKAAPAS
jgi:diguanylate cyclase (GGDEF)-like protein